jgi:selenocysteine lyase/cysteine desulfurase
MECQRDLFSLEDGVHYLNGAAYSPTPKAALLAGQRAMAIQSMPYKGITAQLHFTAPLQVREKLSCLLSAHDADRMAIFPSVSYGMATVAKNIHRIPNIGSKKSIIVLDEEFPNDNYAFAREATELNLTIDVVPMPAGEFEGVGAAWNRDIIAAIHEGTAMVVMSNVHWIYGIKYDLEAISRCCREVGSLLIIDGTQSVGMMPFDVSAIRPDAVICAAYKWCLGPYSIGFGYFGEFFDGGIPLEESWMNRVASDNFPGLLNLQTEYRPKAQRYNMGEFSNFILLAMMEESVDLILKLGVSSMYDYVGGIGDSGIQELRSLGCSIVSEDYRAKHLFGIILPPCMADQLNEFASALKAQNVFVSVRGKAIRVSLCVYNHAEDLLALVKVLQSMVHK